MKTTFIFLCFLFVFSTGFSQETPLRIDYNPKSPNVSSLFDFTDISVGYYTGSISTNLPIVGLSEGPLSTNVNFSYSTSGHKVAERASWVGLGWNLNAGGAVAREIRGKPDDSDTITGFLKFLSGRGYTDINDVVALNSAALAALYDELSRFGCVDTEPDFFSFNVGGLSGSFMFDWDGTLKVTCNRKIKVEYTQVVNKFEIVEWKIIDDLGNKYIFNKKETNEITGLYGQGLFCNNTPYTTAWKLTSIEDSSSKHRIDFDYEDYTMDYPVVYSKQHSITSSGASGQTSSSGAGLKIVGSYIKTIKGNNSQNSIEFIKGSAPRADVTGTNLYPLGSIRLKDKNGIVINEFKFDYENGSRLRLNGIKQVKNSSTIDLYGFEYNNSVGLPSDYDSYSIDHWGYYNGKNNNVLYPTYTFRGASGSILSYPGADREPSTIHSEASVLKKITYPTKGYSEFTYEGHDYSFIQDKSISSNNETIQEPQTAYNSVMGNPNNNNELVQSTSYFDVVINTEVSNENTQCSSPGNCTRKVNLDITAINMSPFAWNIIGPRFKIYDSNNNIVYQKVSIPYDANYSQGGMYQEFESIWLPEDTYRVVAETKNYSNQYNINNFITIHITWNNDTDNTIEKKNVGGVRIKEITEYNYDETLIKKKQFKYILNDSPNLSSGSIDALPKYADIYSYFTEPSGMIESDIVRYTGSLLQLGSNFGHIRYEEVTVDEINGAEKLRTVYKYSKGQPDVISFEKPYPPAVSRAYKKGLLLNETLYEQKNGSFVPVQKTTNQYSYKEIPIPALKASRKVAGISNGSYSIELLYAVAYYYNHIGFNQVSSKKVETYFDQSTIEQNDSFAYDTGLNRVSNSSTSTSKNETLNTEYTYSDTDVSSSINNKMVSKNIVGSPIKTRVLRNGLVISDQETKYKDWGSDIIQPELVKIAKGTDVLEERTQIYQYDNLGNPLEVSKKDGSRQVYIWGYKQQFPIAKIENATYSEVTSAISTLNASYNSLSKIQTLSNSDNDRTIGFVGAEGTLRTALKDLRNALPQSLVTTYTYDPLISVTSVTDASGYTSYYIYDEFNRLKYLKNKDGEVLEEYNYNYKLPDLVASTTSSSSTVQSGQSVTLITTASGGSGNFTYKWTVINANLNQVYNTSTGSLSFATTSNHAPNFTVTCEVKDTQTNETITTTKQINVTTSYPALSVGYISHTSGSNSVGSRVYFGINVSGGSGNYKYSWSKTNSQTTSNLSSTTNTASTRISSSDCNFYTMLCTVKDLTTNETVIRKLRMLVDSGCSSGPGPIEIE